MATVKLQSPEELKQGVLNHCESLRAEGEPYGRYRYHPSRKPTYWASGFVACTRYLFGDLDNLSDKQRNQWIQYLEDGQDEQTGLYIDPIYREDEKLPTKHTHEHVHWHSSTFIMTALHLLGGRIKYPVRACHPYLTPKTMVEKIEILPWNIDERGPWTAGNWTYDIGCMVGHDYRVTKNPANIEAMDAFFKWMEEHQNEYGWWDFIGGKPLAPQQFGGYHTLMVYWMYGRPVPRPEAMIDSSISLQQEDGHFEGGGCCPDMDCIDAICTLSQQYNIRENEARASMEKALPAVLDMQIRGGGFKDEDSGRRGEFGWLQCKVPEEEAPAADPSSDMFRGFSAALISEVLPGTGYDTLPWKHHGTYGHNVRPKQLLDKFNQWQNPVP